MSKFCPQCGKELEDNALVCDSCGFETESEQPETTELTPEIPEPVPAPVEAIVPEPTEEEDVPQTAQESEYTGGITPTVPCAPDRTQFEPLPDTAVPLQQQPESEKKNKFLGLGIGVSIGAVLLIIALIAAIITIVILVIPKNAEPKSAMEKIVQSYIDNDYEAFYQHDYSLMFHEEDYEEALKQAKEMAEKYGTDNSQNTSEVLNVTDLSPETIDIIKEQLEQQGFKDVDKIKDIKVATVQMTGVRDAETGAKGVSVGMMYMILVDGEWYYLSA